MAHGSPDEQQNELVEGLKKGSQVSYQKAVRLYTPSMLLVARFYVSRETAEDVVQDVWLKVIDAIHRFEGRASLKTWLHRIVANQAKNTLRRSGREVAMEFGESLDPALADRFNNRRQWIVPPRLTNYETAEQWLENGALKHCLDKHLALLPEQQRSAVMLYEAHQHKSEDVCNILDITASNLRVLLHRARQRIFVMVETFRETGEC